MTQSDSVPPTRTRVAAYALSVDEGGRVLLCRIAAADPDAGWWTLPGGGLDWGEAPDVAALRELQEETGLRGEVERLAFVDSRTYPDRPDRALGPVHAIRVVYRVRIVGGDLRYETDGTTDCAAWLVPREARELPLVDLAERALDWLGGEH